MTVFAELLSLQLQRRICSHSTSFPAKHKKLLESNLEKLSCHEQPKQRKHKVSHRILPPCRAPSSGLHLFSGFLLAL